MYRCEFHEDLSAYLDRELDPPRRRELERHLTGCTECTDLLKRLEECRDIFTSDFGERAPSGLGRRLREDLAPAKRPSARRHAWRWTAAATTALAAGLSLLCVFIDPTGPPAVDPGLLAGPELYEQLAAAGHPVPVYAANPCGDAQTTGNPIGLDLDPFEAARAGAAPADL